MSLETLLEAARYVEQQELCAKQQLLPSAAPRPLPPPQNGFKIVSPVPLTTSVPQLSQSPPAALVAVPQVIRTGNHSLVATSPAQSQTVVVVSKPQEIICKTSPVVEIAAKPVESTVDKTEDVVVKPARVRHNSQSVPCVVRAGTREVHNKLEKNRRAHLKECFELLKKHLPPQMDEKKTSNLSILHSALRYIQLLKKREREHEHEMERLAREKISAQQRLAVLKKELGTQWDTLELGTTESPPLPLPVAPPPAPTPPKADTVAQLSVLPLPPATAVGYQVLGLHKVALVSRPVTHLLAPAPPALSAKMLPLVNAQYLVKPVVVVSSASAAPRQS